MRGQMVATVPKLMGLSYSILVESGEDYHECSDKMKCPLNYFARPYEHKHRIPDVKPSRLERHHKISRKPYKYCSCIIINF